MSNNHDNHESYSIEGAAIMSPTALKVMLLGEPPDNERICSALFTSGSDYLSIRYVRNEEEYKVFARDLMLIKNVISDLNHAREVGFMDETIYRQELKTQWLGGCVATFIQSYGLQSVPKDVRLAIDNVMKELDIPMENPWPAFKFILLVPSEDTEGKFHHFSADDE